MGGTNLVGEHEVAKRRAEAAAEPCCRTQRDESGETLSQRDGAGAHRGCQVAQRSPDSLPLGVMTDPATGKLRKAEEEVGEPLHHAERGRSKPDRAEVQGENRGDHLVTDVGKEGRQNDADDGPRDPTRRSVAEGVFQRVLVGEAHTHRPCVRKGTITRRCETTILWVGAIAVRRA